MLMHYLSLLLWPLQTPAKTAADHVRACVDRGVTDAVLNLAAPGGRGLSLRLAPSIIFCVGGRAAAIETFLTERASGLRASSVCVRSVAFPPGIHGQLLYGGSAFGL